MRQLLKKDNIKIYSPTLQNNIFHANKKEPLKQKLQRLFYGSMSNAVVLKIKPNILMQRNFAA